MTATALDPKDLKKIMPALRRLALFPLKTVGVVSVETNVEMAQIEAWVKAEGRPTAARIEELEDFLMGGAPEVETYAAPEPEAYRPPAPMPNGSVLAEAMTRARARKAAAAAAPTPAPLPDPAPHDSSDRIAIPVTFTAPSPMKASKPKKAAPAKRSDDTERWTKVVQLLLATDISAAAACKKVGIPVGSWAGWKLRTFGKGKIAPEKLKAFLAAEDSPGKVIEELAQTVFKASPSKKPKVALFRTRKGLRTFLKAAKSLATPVINEKALVREMERTLLPAPGAATPPPIVGCPVCNGFTVHIRGRRPGDPLREVCPACQADRLADIRELADPCAAIAITASPDA